MRKIGNNSAFQTISTAFFDPNNPSHNEVLMHVSDSGSMHHKMYPNKKSLMSAYTNYPPIPLPTTKKLPKLHPSMKKAVHFLPPIDQLADEDHPYH